MDVTHHMLMYAIRKTHTTTETSKSKKDIEVGNLV